MDYKTEEWKDCREDYLLGEVNFGNVKAPWHSEALCELFVDEETLDEYVRNPEFFLEDITQVEISELPKVMLRHIYCILSIGPDYITVSDEMARELDDVMHRIEQILEI